MTLLRSAQSGDLDTIHALVHRAYRGDSARQGWTHEADLLDGQRTDLDALRDMLANPEEHLLIAEDDGGTVGCIAVTDKGSRLVYIGMVTVDPLRQGGGLGRDLLSGAEAFARRELGAERAEMTVISLRSELIRWYERRGYVLTGERRPFPMRDPRFGLPRRDDLEFAVLEKSLTASG